MSKILILSSYIANKPAGPAVSTSGLVLLNRLRQSGYDATLIDHCGNLDYDTQLIPLIKLHADVKLILVSTTLWFTYHGMLSATANTNAMLSWYHPQQNIFKKFLSDLRATGAVVAVGGSATTSTTIVNRLFANGGLSSIDYIVKGQGENSVLALASHVLNGTPILSTHKVGIKTKVIEETDYPFSLNGGSYVMDSLDHSDMVGNAYAPIELARGCAFKCTFCTYPLIGNSSIDLAHTKANLIATLEYYHRNWGITHFSVMDDVINDSVEKVEFVRDVANSLSFTPTFGCYARLDMYGNKKILEISKDTGITSFLAGIETLELSAGKRTGKAFTPDRVRKLVDAVKTSVPHMQIAASYIYLLHGETQKYFEEESLPILTDPNIFSSISMGPLNVPLSGDLISSMQKDPYLHGLTIQDGTWSQGEFTKDELILGAAKWSKEIGKMRRSKGGRRAPGPFTIGPTNSLLKLDPLYFSNWSLERVELATKLYYSNYCNSKGLST